MSRPFPLRSGIAAIFIVMLVLMITSCDKDKPTTPIDETGVVSGTVFSPGRSVLPGVTVSIGNITTLTDATGRFILPGITPGNSIIVNFSKDGYISNQKVVSVAKNQTTYTSSTLFTPVISTFSASTGSTISQGGTDVIIPDNAFVQPGGGAFSGTVQAKMRSFDPTDPQNLDAFPGSFSGIQTDGTEIMFESYGFIYASFADAANPATNLQLASGKVAQIRTFIPYSLQANAPDVMPLWYYDDNTGKWMEEGFATRDGNFYVGNVSHFSWWNFDHPIVVEDQSTLTGKVISAETRGVIPGAQVVATGVNYSGYTTAYTNDQGEFSITVKASAQVSLRAFAGINASQPTPTINTPAGGLTQEVDDLIINDLSFTLIGKLVNTSNTPLSEGYGQVFQVNPPAGEIPFQAWINLTADGSFVTTSSYYGTLTNFEIQIRYQTRGNLYSNKIQFTVPPAGSIRNLGIVTMRPGGNLNGRAITNTGQEIANQWIYFMQEGGQGEGSHFLAETDDNGNFTLTGPQNTTLTNMRGSALFNQTSYITPLMSLQFPASGGNSNLGTVTFSPME